MNIFYTFILIYGSGSIAAFITIYIEKIIYKQLPYTPDEIQAIILFSWVFPIIRLIQAIAIAIRRNKHSKKS